MTAKSDRHITLVGPTHPYAGGIAQHTTRLALELEERGHRVSVESWRAQYPKLLYPGPVTVPDGAPEIGIASNVVEKLTWYNSLSWWAAGWRSRSSHLLAVSIPTPFHAIPYLIMLSAAGGSVPTLGIVHNVLPHEPGPLDRILMRVLLNKLDAIVVHGAPAREQAISLGVEPQHILQLSLPSPWPAPTEPVSKPKGRTGPLRAIFFGTIRQYKGLDILLYALAETNDVELTVAGEFWDDESAYLERIKRLGLSHRVNIRRGYIPQSDFPRLFGSADILVLPYRSGTGSIVREVGFRFGLPVIATNVGSIAEGIEDGVNGRVIEAGNVDALAEALNQASDREALAGWSQSVRSAGQRQKQLWENYTQALVGAMTETKRGKAK